MKTMAPALIRITSLPIDPVTELVGDPEVMNRTYVEVRAEEDKAGGWTLSYTDADGGVSGTTLNTLEELGGQWTGTDPDGSEFLIRKLLPTDAELLSSAGIPQPVEVVEAHVTRGGDMLAGELDAAVAPDNSVATLVLDTGIGLYVRFSGDWQLLPENSSSMDNLSIIPVDPQALEVFDAADAAGSTLTVFDLPRSVDNTYTDVTDREDPLAPVETVTASIPQWYLDKRRSWAQTTSDPAVIVAAGEFVAALESGADPDPSGVFMRDLLRRARAADLLSHPAVVAAVNWRAWLHPRGRDGKFIHKSGIINIFNSPNPSPGESKRRGKVKDLTQRGVIVQILDPLSGKPTGEEEMIPSGLIEDFRSQGFLSPTSGMESKDFIGGPLERLQGAYEEIAEEVTALRDRFPSANERTDDRLTDEQYRIHTQLVDSVNQLINANKLDVASVMKDDIGRWDDEFYEWMLDTVDEIFEADFASKPKDRKSMVTGGLGGSGKSSTLSKLASAGVIDPTQWATINPDDMKEEMISRGIFPDIEGLSPAELSNALHEVSAEMSQLLQQRALDEGVNVIFDITMRSSLTERPDGNWGSDDHRLIQDLKDAGYEGIDAVFVDIPVDKSVENALARHRGGVERLRRGQSAEGGRYVPPAVIEKNRYSPEGRTPNILSFGLGSRDAYEDRYGVSSQERALAARADELMVRMGMSTEADSAEVDELLADFAAAVSTADSPRASVELGALESEWEFLDPRSSGQAPMDRFRSVNSYNFAKATQGAGAPIDGDSVMFDTTDLDAPKLVTASGKFDGVALPQGRPERRTDPSKEIIGLLPEGVDEEEKDRVADIMSGLSTGSHELLSIPTSESDDGRYRLHIGLVHGDEVDSEAWIEFDSTDTRDDALSIARGVQDAGFADRAQKVSALSEAPEDVVALANGLVDPGPVDTRANKLRSRTRMAKRLEPVKNADGTWSLRDSTSGNIVGVSGDREAISARRTQLLNTLYPPI